MLHNVQMASTIAVTEARSVQQGVIHDVREDGRTRLQRRPVHISNRAVDVLGTEEYYNGSAVEVEVSGTTVIATASPSVVEGGGPKMPDNEEASQERPTGRKCEGQLHIHIDAVPNVVDFYAAALGGRPGRYRRVFLSHIASIIRQVFGAESVTVQEQPGVAEAQPLADFEEDDEEPVPAVTPFGGARALHGISSGFPRSDLCLGNDFYFRIDVDVHILQAAGGNILSCVALAVYNALRTIKLPAVTLHEAPSGVSVEVDRSKPFNRAVDWSHLPVLCVMLLSPTRHYVVDPSPREELAMPQQMHVATNANGEVCYVRYHQLPSRGGNRLLLDEVSDNMKCTRATGSEQPRAVPVAPPFLTCNLMDLTATLSDAVYVCQSMIVECEELCA